ncbi:DUF6036 family nucleotidyltransferase [Rhodopirellula sp. JC639]|uniref:DUF6036 family nucleotidyltransferase n=1 Tax=Stieleria mannarensis TaxID=2755585 RepID=UPI0015FF99E0|nr:DUF6036 family nucleotidyltransferase [Rhodopirellula sp. JC639]
MLIEVLAKFAGELEARNYRYALIGGLAASIRGRIRATEDIDLIALCNLDDALDLVESLGNCGFSPLLENYEQVARSALLIPVIDRSSGIQLDLAIGLSGFEKDIVERADPMIFEGHEIFVATPEDLVVLKTLAGRARDLDDVKGIVEVLGERFDWQYCLAAAKRLESAVDIDLVQQIKRLRPS